MPDSTAAQRLLTEPPSLARTFARAVLTSGFRSRGLAQLPDTVLKLAATVDRDQLLAYQKLCGFPASDELPPTYPHLLGFPLQARLMAAPEFPLPLAGLVHVRNEIRQHHPLRADDEPLITVTAENLHAHPRGTTVDLVTSVETPQGVLAWESRSTYLRRGAASGGKTGTVSETEAEAIPGVPTGMPVTRWRLPADLGRRYAAVSGDVNHIHLHPWTARLFGFRRAIAHGMWTHARTLAALGPQVRGRGESVVWFRKPVLLPSTVRLIRTPPDNPVTVAALVSGGPAPTPHLITSWTSA